MDERMRGLIKTLRRMGSEKAADYLLEHFPAGTQNSGPAMIAIPHLPWLRADQVRLAKHYLSTIPHAGDGAYEAFSSFMSVPRFLRVVEKNMPQSEDGKDLLFYYLRPVLRKAAKSESDREAVAEFLRRYDCP